MASREDMGSWLEGGAADRSGPSSAERLGLPGEGHGSPARVGRRVVALVIDWAVASLVAFLLTNPGSWSDMSSWAPLLVFAVENVLLVSTAGFTVGHRLLGLQVRVLGAPEGTYVGFARGAVRTLLLCLVIPAVVWGNDGRGLHDRAAGTVIVRR
ncbi:RDD family protein [Isoptericola sp. NEAU-Y5]|uniref:RDD family protein n=1 Tax=Isoptericola luteus TaxID=2879484 RepID=A0ABS7ZKH9_9MICO|nr:RDD family protein [Isoptericola sp. NEAU-Y5]MCA5895002.1 RDD family protein [Isoptericola sp. NEAU-Y5]